MNVHAPVDAVADGCMHASAGPDIGLLYAGCSAQPVACRGISYCM